MMSMGTVERFIRKTETSSSLQSRMGFLTGAGILTLDMPMFEDAVVGSAQAPAGWASGWTATGSLKVVKAVLR